MYALKLVKENLKIVRIQSSHLQAQNKFILTFRNQSEARAALGYLSCLIADIHQGNFNQRWLNECYLTPNLYLCPNDPQDLRAQLESNTKQRIEFIFEQLVIDFDPSKVSFFCYRLFDDALENVIVKTHTPIKFSLHSKRSEKQTLIAAYDLYADSSLIGE